MINITKVLLYIHGDDVYVKAYFGESSRFLTLEENDDFVGSIRLAQALRGLKKPYCCYVYVRNMCFNDHKSKKT